MAGKVRAIPDGYHTVTPYLMVKDGAAALDFYRRAFGAKELYRLAMPDGRVGHAELQIGSSRLMLADEMEGTPDVLAQSPATLGGTTSGFCLYVEDVDGDFERAVAAGGKVKRPVTNQFYGDRTGSLEDPFGHSWTLATHIEDVSPEEMKRRMAEMK